MRLRFKWGIAGCVILASVSLLAPLAGCKKSSSQPEAPKQAAPETPAQTVARMKSDPVYTNQLIQARATQTKIAARLLALAQDMEQKRVRARAALDPKATKEQVEQELDNNPSKYPGWRELKVRYAELEQTLADARKQARGTVRTMNAKIQATLNADKTTPAK